MRDRVFSTLTHTYSIIAFDPDTKQLGAAMQTHNFAACNGVIWVEPGVGAIASQADADPFYAYAGFALLRLGKTAEQALHSLVHGEGNAPQHQVAMLDVRGHVAAYTGDCCIPAAGHTIGRTYACQANLMEHHTVWEAMGAAFEHSGGALVDRLMAALEAAERAGGDLRGAQSAALKIASSERLEHPWDGYDYDFRVYDSRTPLQDLWRLIHTQRLHDQVDAAYDLLDDTALDDAKCAVALQRFQEAVQQLPNSDSQWQQMCSYGLTLVNKGRVAEALPLFQRVFAAAPVWREVVRRVATVRPERPYAHLLDTILAQ